jgi:hypothetical protein
MSKENNPLFSARPDKPTDEDKKEEGKDLTDYDKFKEKFEEQSGQELTIDNERPAPIPTLPNYDPNASGTYVKYNGYATLRIITPSQWKAVGVHDTGRKEWNHLNKYKVPVSELSKGALKYLLETDGSFELVES